MRPMGVGQKRGTKMAKSKKSEPVDTSYNGWKNYETWAVSLWIDNEEGSYNHARFMARDAYREAMSESDEMKKWAHGKGKLEEAIRARADRILADQLKEWVEEQAPNLGATMFADLLNAALSEVDWYEIAHSMQGE
jgi:hypothetical protein